MHNLHSVHALQGKREGGRRRKGGRRREGGREGGEGTEGGGQVRIDPPAVNF